MLLQLKASHIVDELIAERCPSFVNHWSWLAVRPVLYQTLKYRHAVEMTDEIQRRSGGEAFDFLSEQLQVEVSLKFADRLPKQGRVILAINHPTGLADGVAIWSAIKPIRPDIEILANADALRVSERLADVIIPVEWVVEKRTAAKTKETLRRARSAFEQEKCVIIFPSGKLAGRENGRLVERPWMPTVVSLARKQNCPVVPIHMNAENSWLYYWLSNVNNELRDITLFHELLNKRGALFDLTIGPLIPPEDLRGDTQEVTDRLMRYVSYDLQSEPNRPFAEWCAKHAAPLGSKS